MLFLRGTRTARIKTYIDHEHNCNACGCYDLTVAVYQPYYHFLFIPIAPIGEKTAKIWCNQCKQIFRMDSLSHFYESKSRSPIWMYSWIILFGLPFIIGIAGNIIHNYF
ncbi:MAG TPA: zinc-ribbon domain-containing protein [Puia sp.]|jgi:hypothetical protein|nr:zinc-ribbon domain-containing protein [Puia sp.]